MFFVLTIMANIITEEGKCHDDNDNVIFVELKILSLLGHTVYVNCAKLSGSPSLLLIN